jgi:predicted nucleic acid-binding protein
VTAVIDASVLAKWFVEEENTSAALRLQSLKLFAPDLLIVETTNVLWKKVRLGGFDPAFLAPAVRVMRYANLTLIDSLTLADRAVEIALRLNHAVYDCYYLALAEQRNLPMVSADDRLGRKLSANLGLTPARVLALTEFAADLPENPHA